MMKSSTSGSSPGRGTGRRSKSGTPEPVKRLAGGNPQVAKGDGDAPVQAYIAAMPGWKRAIGERLDALIVEHVPEVQKAVRWNSPFYGTSSNGWLVSFHVLTRHVQLNFFCGSLLDPVPPGKGKDPQARWLNIREEDALDEARIAAWLQQATRLKGWASFSS